MEEMKGNCDNDDEQMLEIINVETIDILTPSHTITYKVFVLFFRYIVNSYMHINQLKHKRILFQSLLNLIFFGLQFTVTYPHPIRLTLYSVLIYCHSYNMQSTKRR